MKVSRLMAAASILCLAFAGCGGSSKDRSGTATTSSTAATGSAPNTGSTATTSSTATTRPSPVPNQTTPSPTPSREVSPGVVSASTGGITATMHASTHTPRVNRAWSVSFTVRRNGRPVKAEVRYQYLFAGQVVARRSHYRFTGNFHDVFQWPASAVGYPLTFRAEIGAEGVTLNLDYSVQVSR